MVLDHPTLCDAVRTVAREVGPDAFGQGYEHCNPLLADHRTMDAFGTSASLVAKADTIDGLLEALVCTSLVAAKSGTTDKLRP